MQHKSLFAAVMLATSITAAHAQIVVTSVIAAQPDPNNTVPKFNAVPGAGIVTWSDGLAEGVLVAGQPYGYCVSLASATADGKASIAYTITRGVTKIQGATILTAKQFKVSSNGVYYACTGGITLPSSPGTATLTGVVTYTPTGGKATISKLAVPVILQ